MKKHELIDRVADVTGQPKVTVRTVLDAACDVVHVAIKTEPVFLMGLGKLSVVRRGEKHARNMRTGEPVIVPERNGIHFAPSTGLMRALNAR